VCELYLRACEALGSFGLMQYEISNFAKQGFESWHNLKYWNDEPYAGIGPAAHSFVGGKRFFYPRDTVAFLRGDPPAEDGDGGDFAEYAMLRLRLTAGLTEQGTRERFGVPIPQSVYRRARNVPPQYLTADESGVRLTREGFLVSNAIIAELLADI
jgi:oxygen-independent coproporphyrinogen-3 oxidase